MARGVFTLSRVRIKEIKNEWEDPNNVWIFPDGGGSEFKFIDGTVTPAPAATPDGPTYIKVNIGGNYAFPTGTSAGGFPRPKRVRGIYATAEFIFLAVKDNTNSILIYNRKSIFLWDAVDNSPCISTNINDYPAGALRKISYANAETDDAWGDCITVDSTNEKICVSSTTGAHLWNFDGTGYVNIDKAGTGTGGIADDFGNICACGDGKVVIGNPFETGPAPDSDTKCGAVYVYNLDGTGELKIQPSTNAIRRGNSITYNSLNLEFGRSVSIGSNRIVVGAPGGSLTWIRNYHGEVFTYKLDGTGETWHFAEDPDDATYNYGDGVTAMDRAGQKVVAKEGKMLFGAGICDEQAYGGSFFNDPAGSGVVYLSDIPDQTATGEYRTQTVGTYKDWSTDDLLQGFQMFGDSVNVGLWRRTSSGTSRIQMILAPAQDIPFAKNPTLYYNKFSFSTGDFSSTSASGAEYQGSRSNGDTSDVRKNAPFDAIERHILIGDVYDATDTDGTLRARLISYDQDYDWQIMAYPPLL